MSPRRPSIAADDTTYDVVLRCPRCGEKSDASAYLTTRLTVDGPDGSLSARFHTKPVDHKCWQIRMPDPGQPMLVSDDTDTDDEREPDWAERAAGPSSR